MGIRNYLIEGVSGSGKTAVATELERRGYHAVHGDRVLAYKGDPLTAAPVTLTVQERATEDPVLVHRHHLWDIQKVKSLVADHGHVMSFFCGGSRNFPKFIDLFDDVFVLHVDLETLNRRLDSRSESEFGGKAVERGFILRLHAGQDDIPKTGRTIDATVPIASVVDEILSHCARRMPT